jgi:hypothetical protein
MNHLNQSQPRSDHGGGYIPLQPQRVYDHRHHGGGYVPTQPLSSATSMSNSGGNVAAQQHQPSPQGQPQGDLQVIMPPRPKDKTLLRMDTAECKH